MRLSADERHAIHQAAAECLAPGSAVRLFGSRLDDRRRGGDIDLLIEPPHPLAPDDLVAVRNRFTARLYRLLGERRIDVLLVAPEEADDRPVVRAARRDGLLLTRVPA